MGRRNRQKSRRRQRKGRAPPTANRAQPLPEHPLGTYGLDWDDDFAWIAGFTSGGAPFGVPWADATYLLDDPQLAEDVLRAQEDAGYVDGLPPPVSHDAALGLDTGDGSYDEIPF